MAFPFLRKLADAGDLRAKHMFQEEIIKRFNHGYFRIMVFLLNNNYFSYLDVEQFEHLDLSSLFSITANQQSEILLSINNINVKDCFDKDSVLCDLCQLLTKHKYFYNLLFFNNIYSFKFYIH